MQTLCDCCVYCIVAQDTLKPWTTKTLCVTSLGRVISFISSHIVYLPTIKARAWTAIGLDGGNKRPVNTDKAF
jgi:hypothetical protein